jgi:hypothetical protein
MSYEGQQLRIELARSYVKLYEVNLTSRHKARE